jgi:hypothetical protein
MKDKAKMVAFLAIGEMTFVAVGALAWKQPLLAHLTSLDGSETWRRVFGQAAVIISVQSGWPPVG